MCRFTSLKKLDKTYVKNFFFSTFKAFLIFLLLKLSVEKGMLFIDLLYFYIIPCVEVIFYIFHFLILLVLIKYRKTLFHSPFFTIFKILIVADLAYFLAVSFPPSLVTAVTFQCTCSIASMVAVLLDGGLNEFDFRLRVSED